MAIYICIKAFGGGDPRELEYMISDGEKPLLFRKCRSSRRERRKIVKEIDKILEDVYGK